MIAIELLGMSEATQEMIRIREGMEELSHANISITATEPYAYGIEYGVTMSGRVARAVGGAFYLRGAKEEVERQAANRLATAIPQGGNAVRGELQNLTKEAINTAKSIVPKVSGALAGSIIEESGSTLGTLYGMIRGRRTVRSAFGLRASR